MAERILDGHSHAFPDVVAPAAIKALLGQVGHLGLRVYHDGTVAGLLAGMDRAGISRTILCSVATRPGQVRKITEWSASIASERIIPFASIHPDFEPVEAEVERIAALGLRGLKFHPQYMDCAVDDPRAMRIARAAAAAGLAMCYHGGQDPAFPRDELGSPRQFRRVHELVPNLRMQVCHLGGWLRWSEAVDELAGQAVYLETSFALDEDCPPAAREAILARHPKEYVVFGTDSPWLDQKEELSRFCALGLGGEAQRLALWENAHRFVGMAEAG